MKKLYHVPAGRSEDQRQYMLELEAGGICVFCPEYFEQYHREQVQIDGRYWYVTSNDYPYRGSSLHLLLVPKRHVTALEELPNIAGAELWKLLKQIKAIYKPPTEAIVLRSGDMRYNGGSVAHAHVHFIVGDVFNPEHESIRFKLSSRSSQQNSDVRNPPSSS